MATSHGTKVTKDTRAKEEIPEAVGTVTSGSLAADSLTNGEFGRNNPKADATSQPSRSTTTNNHDTSSATTFDPAQTPRLAKQEKARTSSSHMARTLPKEDSIATRHTQASTRILGLKKTQEARGVEFGSPERAECA
ncbi:hypothetical protein V2W45_1364891 [Cenococcum geophilum]